MSEDKSKLKNADQTNNKNLIHHPKISIFAGAEIATPHFNFFNKKKTQTKKTKEENPDLGHPEKNFKQSK